MSCEFSGKVIPTDSVVDKHFICPCCGRNLEAKFANGGYGGYDGYARYYYAPTHKNH